MRLLIVHLSDIHLKGDQDSIFEKIDGITHAVQNIAYDLDGCLLIVTGDIAYSGTEFQYIAALDLLDRITSNLKSGLRAKISGTTVPVHVAVVPGNHDCDFSDNDGVRKLIKDGIIKDSASAMDKSVVGLCTAVQRQYFQFLDAIETVSREPGDADFHPEMYYEYHFDISGERVSVLCCNTALLSELHESPGELYFPANAISDDHSDSKLVFAAFHHPYNWIQPQPSREFRKKIESVADFVLSGHEHDGTRRTQEVSPGQYNICVEGGVLQDSEDPLSSSFNAFVIDTDQGKQKFAQYNWSATGYSLGDATVSGQEGSGLAWFDLKTNAVRQHKTFALTEAMAEFLDDPGAPLQQKGDGKLRLSEIFVYPDLLRANLDIGGRIDRVRGHNVIRLIDQTDLLVISGDTECGKTSLGKMVFQHFHESGGVPIFLDASKVIPRGDRLLGFLETEFTDQYGSEDLEAFRQMDHGKRAVIIDNFDRLQISPRRKREFLQTLTQFADRILVLSNDLAVELDELFDSTAGGPVRSEFEHYRIQPLGHLLRGNLIEKWMLLGEDSDADSIIFAQKLTATTAVINTIVGKNFVPAFPIFILAVLQAADLATPVDMTASTNGYFYELLIRSALARGRNKFEFDIIGGYLAYLAHEIHVSGRAQFTDSEFRQIHEKYEDE